MCVHVFTHITVSIWRWEYNLEVHSLFLPWSLGRLDSDFHSFTYWAFLPTHEHILRRRNQLGQIPLINKMKTELDTTDHIAGMEDFNKHFWWMLILLRQKSWVLPLWPLFPPQKILHALCSDIPRSAHISLFPWWNVHSCSRFKERHYTVIADTTGIPRHLFLPNEEEWPTISAVNLLKR